MLSIKRPRSLPSKFNYWSKWVVNGCKGKLLKHQNDALRELQKWFCRDKRRDIALVSMPTGSGKTGVICCLPYFLAEKKEDSEEIQFDKPVLVIAPNLTISDQLEQQILVSKQGHDKSFLLRREIVAVEDQRDVLPSAGWKTESTLEVSNQEFLRSKEVVIANAQKFLVGPWEENLSDDLFKLVIIDEAHHFPAETWAKIIRKFQVHALVVFFTATPYRSDHQTVVRERPFAYHLSLREARENQIIRRTAWHELHQDPNDAERDQDLKRLVLEEVKRIQEKKNEEQPLPGNVPHMAIAITEDTDEADDVAHLWNSCFGEDTALGFHSGARKHELKNMMARIQGNDVKLVVVVDMLLEGFDHPPISIAAIMTKIVSPVKFVQFIGRAQRVVRKEGEKESSEISADIVTHKFYHQKENYDKFENEDLIEP